MVNVSRGPHWYQPNTDAGSLVSNETAAGTQLPTTAACELVTDGGRDVVETDGGMSSFTGDDSSVSPEGTTDTKETTDQQFESEDVDIDELAERSRSETIDILEGFSKPKLIALIMEFLDDDESNTEVATTEATSGSTEDTMPEGSAATEPPAEPSSQSDGSPPDDGETTPTPDEPAGDTTWETQTDYQRPPALDLSPGSTILVQCGSQDDRKSAARHDLLGLSASDPRNVLLIQYRAMPTDELESIADAAKRVKIISIGCSQSIPPSVEEVSNPSKSTIRTT
jgi:hypothetical protein